MEDFNQLNPKRIDLLKRLDEAIGHVTPHFWAACQICDLDKLEEFLQIPNAHVFVHAFGSDISHLVRYWRATPGVISRPTTPKTPTPQKSTALNPGPSPSSLPPPKRQKLLDSSTSLPLDSNAEKRAEERDQFCCVLTGIEFIEVAHIYPHHSMRQKEDDRNGPRHKFWATLQMFWPDEKVEAWKATVFPDGIDERGQEEVYNLISLAPQVHGMWEQGLFALKPISESVDKKTLTVQFFWQTRQKNCFPRILLTTQPHSTNGLNEVQGAHGGPIWLVDKKKNPIQSGDLFELGTDDPITKPLPSFELLELQWFLQRVQGMTGAANVDQEESWPDMDTDSD